jgi:autotransporter-associated beta strand protein
MTVPNGPSDTATFGFSNITDIGISANTEVSGMTFTADATNAYSIYIDGSVTRDLTLTISGSGITNNSGSTPNISAFSYGYGDTAIVFQNSASAGNADIYVEDGYLSFFDRSTAGAASIGTDGFCYVSFYNSSSAGGAVFSLSDVTWLYFLNTSTAGSANIDSDGNVVFSGSSSAANARISILGNDFGGSLSFDFSSTGDTAQIEFFSYQGAGAFLAIDGHNAPGVSIGSLAGDQYSLVFLGGNNLTVGSNSLNTTFAGGFRGNGGSLTKTGSGKLTLTNADPYYGGSTYTGGTIINNGVLIVNNTSGSATGTGRVQIISGALNGTGIISGPVTVGNGITTGAILRGGVGNSAGTLTINNTVTFRSKSSYTCYLNRVTPPKAGTVRALGVAINANVAFTLVETGTAALARGTKFRVIDNTSANPIFGRFSNLPDNSTFTHKRGTTFKVSYTGGTGNDLVLTVQ